MTNQIHPCLWFDGNGKEAAELYCSVFQYAKIITDTPMVVVFELEGRRLMALNGGPMFTKNPSISLFVTCKSMEETERIWHRLVEGGNAIMPLGKYPWAEKYGWLVDRFGMSWQLMRGDFTGNDIKIDPAFLFVNEQYGNARAAMKKYNGLFPGSAILAEQLYDKEDDQPEGNLKFGEFLLGNDTFIAMDGYGKHDFNFNEGISFVVECNSQEEIDYYWQKLTQGGEESMCGWLKDSFGVSWQIVPKILGKLITDKDKGPRAMQALLQMKKIDVAVLQNA